MNGYSEQYNQIARAINFIAENSLRRPSLEEVAAHVHLSPFHFQRMFSEWAGVSPKKLVQFLSLGHAKQLLARNSNISLFDAADEAGLSGTGRLHDLFVSIEGMTPAEYRDGGKDLTIQYSTHQCQFGNYLVASTSKGVCHLSFFDSANDQAIQALADEWPRAKLTYAIEPLHAQVQQFFTHHVPSGARIHLHLRGTPFQLKVWEALLKIPGGSLTTYGQIAADIGNMAASRAVGTAIGSNHVAYLIPCHRVINNTGIIGNFRWGSERKKAIILWETATQLSGSNIV